MDQNGPEQSSYSYFLSPKSLRNTYPHLRNTYPHYHLTTQPQLLQPLDLSSGLSKMVDPPLTPPRSLASPLHSTQLSPSSTLISELPQADRMATVFDTHDLLIERGRSASRGFHTWLMMTYSAADVVPPFVNIVSVGAQNAAKTSV